MKSKDVDIVVSRAEAAVKERDVEQLVQVIRELCSVIRNLQQELALVKKKTYGPKSEKTSKKDNQPPTVNPPLPNNVRDAKDLFQRGGKGSNNQPTESALATESIRVRVPEDLNLTCPICRGELKDGGVARRASEIDIADSLYVQKEYLLHKAVCQCGSLRLLMPGPERGLDKCEFSPRFIAKVIFDKFCNSLPLTRQAQSMTLQGLQVGRNRLINMVLRSWVLFAGLVERMREINRQQYYRQVDESPVSIVAEHYKNKGYIWALLSKQAITYQITPTRNKSLAKSVIGSEPGVLTSDRLNIYHQLFADLSESGCLSHARRKFFDSLLSFPDEAFEVLYIILDLYGIEAIARKNQLNPAGILALRKRFSIPLLHNLYTTVSGMDPPKGSTLYKAIKYLKTHWSALTFYCRDGSVPIDNNGTENALRKPKLGFKNFLFAQSELGAEAVAGFYSIIATCRLHHINPIEYLADVLVKLNNGWPNSKIDDLLPWNWKSGQLQTAPALQTKEKRLTGKYVMERLKLDKRLKAIS